MTIKNGTPTTEAPSENQYQCTTEKVESQAIPGTTTVNKPLAPQERRAYDALFAHPEGLKSYDLRVLTKCSYAPGVVKKMIEKGYQISCEIEQDGFNTDGKPTFIGRYKLRPAGEVLLHD